MGVAIIVGHLHDELAHPPAIGIVLELQLAEQPRQMR